MTSYRISQLAERSGVPATTLRFYESAGLLPAERTASGYRVYGEEAVERLAFISSAKLLGLALEEIRELLGVREEGVCGSVRARMLPLIADRIRETDGRIAELRAFSGHLAEAHAELSGPPPAGPCGPECGCTTRPAAEAPVACTLDRAELDERAGQWRALVAGAGRRETLDGGLRLSFPPDAELAGRLAALAAAEQDCCAFFDFTLHFAPSVLQLTVRAPESADAMLAELFGAPA